MRIKRFYESVQVDISTDRVEDMIKDLKEKSSNLDKQCKDIITLKTELDGYRNVSKKSNDQIDDSIAALEIIQNDLEDAIDKLDTVLTNLIDYKDNGRKYLYSETK